MPDNTPWQSITHLGRAIDQGDLEAASASCRRLQSGLAALTEPELMAVRAELLACREKAYELREACASQLRNTMRGRQKISAYRGGSSPG